MATTKTDLSNLKKVAEKVKSYVDGKTEDLNGLVTAEQEARIAADKALQGNIDAEVTRAKGVEGGLDTRVSAIEDKIPSEASSTNKLADKAFVNSSIATATATFRGTKETKAEIKALTGDLNDYCYLIVKDATTGLVKQYDRYKYTTEVSEETGNWEFEYTLNNSSFTAEQWAAITSGITADLVAKIGSSESAIADEAAARQAADKVLETNINAEITRAKTAEAQEVTDRKAGDEATLASAKTYVDNTIADLDVAELTPSASETISSIKQVDGKISVAKQTIAITQSQITDAATASEVTSMLTEVFGA